MHRQHLKRLLYFFFLQLTLTVSQSLSVTDVSLYFTVPGNCMDKNALYILGMHYAKK